MGSDAPETVAAIVDIEDALSVRTTPCAIALTRIPMCPHSTAIVAVRFLSSLAELRRGQGIESLGIAAISGW